MRILAAVFLLSTVEFAASAQAQTASAIRQKLAADNKECTLQHYEEFYRGAMPGVSRPVVIASYTLEGCGGGNNWGTSVGVFAMENGRIRQFRSPYVAGPNGGGKPGITVTGNRFTVQSLDYGPDDARCCPTVRKTESFEVLNGSVVVAR